MSNTGGGDARLWNRSWQFYIGVSMPCLLGLLIANGITSMLQFHHPERVTISIECCYQNVGIATSVALTMFQGNQLASAMGVPLFYGFIEAFILGIYCIVCWKMNWTKAPPDVNFFTMLMTSYEVLEAEENEMNEIEVKLSYSEDDDIERTSNDGNTFFTYFRYTDNHNNNDTHDTATSRSSRWRNSLWSRGKKEPSGIVMTTQQQPKNDDISSEMTQQQSSNHVGL